MERAIVSTFIFKIHEMVRNTVTNGTGHGHLPNGEKKHSPHFGQTGETDYRPNFQYYLDCKVQCTNSFSSDWEPQKYLLSLLIKTDLF